MEKKINKFAFTDERLRRLTPQAKPTFFFDTEQAGLRLLVSVAGTKSFQFQKWSPAKGRPVTLTLGKWSDMSIDEARAEVERLVVEVRAGKDPAEEKRQQREELTVAEAAAQYMAESDKKSALSDDGRIRLHILPTFGGRRLSELTEEAVAAWHKGLVRKKGLAGATANHCLKLLGAIFKSALPTPPCPLPVSSTIQRSSAKDSSVKKRSAGSLLRWTP